MEIATKNLSRTDAQIRLTIPTKSLHRFPPLSGKQTVDFQVRDESGVVWKFGIYVRRGRYPKPVITKGWRKFVSCNKLCRGDTVRFYRDEEQAEAGHVLYHVKVERAVKVFDANFAHKALE